MLVRLFKCIARAALVNVPKALLDNLPFGNAAYDFTKDVVKNWREVSPNAVERRVELQEVAVATPTQVLAQAKEAVAAVAADQPVALQLALVSYLTHLPGTVRRSLSRPADRTGKTVPPTLTLDKPEDVMPFLPARRPRFQPGDRPHGVGDWHLVELLGVGGFGEVWKATNPHRPGLAPVALKFCLDERAIDALKNETDLLDRVESEGTHDGIVRLRHTYLSADPPCLEYEYIAGGDLGSLIAERHVAAAPTLFQEVTSLMHELCGIVAFAHSRKPPIVHRDLKPANILVQPRADGTASLRVADFGIGGVALASAMTQTRRGTTPSEIMPTKLRGAYTPLYASEQQMNSEKPHPRDDVYSLGVIWYQMLTGDLSKGRPSNKAAERLGEKGLAPELVKLLLECVEDERHDRPADAGAMQQRIAPFVKRTPTPPPPPPPPPLPEPKPEDLADQLERALTLVKRTEATARQLAEKDHDYAKAVVTLETVPAKWHHLRDAELLQSVTARRDRAALLDAEIKAGVANARLTGLRDKVIELLSLWPHRADLQRLLDSGKLPREAGEVIALSLPCNIAMRFAWCPPGSFVMGSPANKQNRAADESQHRVTLSRGFWMGVTPVTQAQWQSIMGANPSNWMGPNLPVENVSWDDCQTFCQKLSQAAGKKFRLPTEAEWEHGYRAGTQTSYYFGADAGRLGEYAWYDDNSAKQTHEVGQKKPNPWALFDVAGNVWEWCQDWYGLYPTGDIKDPQGSNSGDIRVLRGGSWYGEARHCRAACRYGFAPSFRYHDVGCRLVLCQD